MALMKCFTRVPYSNSHGSCNSSINAEPIARIVPEHTREAFFQAYCDLRTNVPKDRRWVEQHAAALQPRTLLGWLVRLLPK